MDQTTIFLVRGDRNYDLNFTLTDSLGNVVNLTGATLKFNAQLGSDSSVQFSGTMTIVNAAQGTCKYTVQATDFDVAGMYNCQIEVDFGSVSEKVTFSGILASVEESIPIN